VRGPRPRAQGRNEGRGAAPADDRSREPPRALARLLRDPARGEPSGGGLEPSLRRPRDTGNATGHPDERTGASEGSNPMTHA